VARATLAVARATLAVEARNGQAAWAGLILSPQGGGSSLLTKRKKEGLKFSDEKKIL